MKAILYFVAVVSLAVLGFVTPSSGQVVVPDLTNPTVYDKDCSDSPPGYKDCDSTDFTAWVTGTYTLWVSLSCGTTDCDSCKGIARVLNIFTGETCMIHTSSTRPNCEVSTWCNLTQGSQYRLYACLRNMNTETCENCKRQNCSAIASLTQP